MDELLNDIFNYIEYLKQQGLNITVHGAPVRFDAFRYRFVNYNIHNIPYCIAVKSNREAWDKCIACQKKVYKKCEDGPFWGMCYAGVEEFIVPVRSGKVVGFISVSGYRLNPEKARPRIRKTADDFALSYDYLIGLYNTLNNESCSDEKLLTLVMPLSHMLRLFYDFAVKIYPEKSSVPSGTDYIYSNMVVYLNKNFASKISVDELGNLFHCSSSNINHIFKKRSGKNINDYINTLRVEEAKKLLAGSIYPISDISGMCGFSDSNYFSTVFKKYCGLPPLRYRKNVQ